MQLHYSNKKTAMEIANYKLLTATKHLNQQQIYEIETESVTHKN